jgi:predicted DNA-binding transcriptional regulator AlpA
MEPLLNMEEAAALLKLTRQQMYELTRTRSRCRQAVPIPVVQIGKRKMFRASSLNNWIAQLEKQETVQ